MAEIIVGIVSGIISGTGMGGGTILILVLSFFMNVSQHKAQATNLVFFIPTSIAAIIGNINQKLINWKVRYKYSNIWKHRSCCRCKHSKQNECKSD